ncbi:GtrA family protein [Amycolatopsis acididurans]|uniref:GtrA family protein n=1 Tax=Amycolatopsis acididurans TaxID=2724524 RepID=UPI0028AC932F|nr:GtrA family protein [Amycolatopsis acididurans]
MRPKITSAPERFEAFCAAVVRPLPFRLPASVLGFAIINGFTFGVDLVLLTVGHSVLGLPLPVSITIAYVSAFGLSFVLNRALNFRSHAPVGGQAVKYAIAIAVNYLAFILGVGAGLAALGVEYHLARVLAGACEAIFMYSAMRWVVFAESRSGAEEGTRSPRATRGQPR